MANKPVDHGETELQSVVRLSGVEELYLIKIPKDVNFSALDGVKLKRFENECPIETLNFKMGGYVLDARCNVDPSGFRAIVNKGDKNGTQIANPFSGHLSLRKVIKIPKRSTSAPAVC